jgi:hypothetical protein
MIERESYQSFSFFVQIFEEYSIVRRDSSRDYSIGQFTYLVSGEVKWND